MIIDLQKYENYCIFSEHKARKDFNLTPTLSKGEGAEFSTVVRQAHYKLQTRRRDLIQKYNLSLTLSNLRFLEESQQLRLTSSPLR